eukprot:gene12243-14176_t
MSTNEYTRTKRAVLWDVDGTLSDSYLLGYTCTLTVLANNGYDPISEEEYHAGTKYATPDRFSWHLTRDTKSDIGPKLGKQFDDLYVGLVSTSTAGFFPGMSELLTELNAEWGDTMRYGALSNACGSYVNAVLRANCVDSMFSVALGADQVSAPKPHPDGLLAICQQMDVHPSECVYIGDSPSDGQAATAAGMHSIGVSWGSHAVENVIPAFTHTAYTVDELRGYIDQFLARP